MRVPLSKNRLPLIAVAICGGVICSKRLLGRFFSRRRKQHSDTVKDDKPKEECVSLVSVQSNDEKTAHKTTQINSNTRVYSHVPNTRVKSRFYREHVGKMIRDGRKVSSACWEDDWSIPCTTSAQVQEQSPSPPESDIDDDNSSVESITCLCEQEEKYQISLVNIPRLDLTKALEIQEIDLNKDKKL